MPRSSLNNKPPQDQADGLRRLFTGSRVRFVPVVSNPNVAHASALLEALCRGFAELGLNTLVVDAGEASPPADELASVDLASCIEKLSREVSYLAARGLPMRHLNSKGSAASFLEALTQAAPQAEVVLLHAGAAELARVVASRDVLPVLLADLETSSITHAYASMKWLSSRAGLMVYSLLLAANPQLRAAGQIAQRIGSCGDGFLGAVLRDWACFDPKNPPSSPLPDEVRHLCRELLAVAAPGVALQASADAAPLRPLPTPRYSFLAAAI